VSRLASVGEQRVVLIVQHGEKERFPGDPGLSVRGRLQAAAAGRWISGQFSVNELWSSPLRRAAETASELALWTGNAIGIDERLRERMNWEGPVAQPIEDFLAEWCRCSTDRSYVPLYGDSSAMAAERFLAALAEMRSRGTVSVVVSHGGVTVDALRTIVGDEVLVAANPGLIAEGVPGGAVTELVWSGGGWEPKRIAITGHLATTSPANQKERHLLCHLVPSQKLI
jgi:broad specificity phosphatase PhoE